MVLVRSMKGKAELLGKVIPNILKAKGLVIPILGWYSLELRCRELDVKGFL